jgi:phage baseplate assembly protein W
VEKITPGGFKRRKLYKGFSTYNYEVNGTHAIYDVDCVKVDLLNHIYTRRGSRPMMPTFGTRIPDMIMEQLDVETIDILESDIRAVIAYDPRVELAYDGALKITAVPDKNMIIIAATLRYIELNYVDSLTLHLEFGN